MVRGDLRTHSLARERLTLLSADLFFDIHPAGGSGLRATNAESPHRVAFRWYVNVPVHIVLLVIGLLVRCLVL